MIGAGYVGLVTAACLAEFGHRVICAERDVERLAMLNAGLLPIYEPELDRLVAENQSAGRLAFTGDVGEAVAAADLVFIAVGTPSRELDGAVELTHVFDAAREVARALTGDGVIVIKSTVPPGTGDRVEAIVREVRADIEIAVASNPEFLREGVALDEFKHPDRNRDWRR